MLSHLAKVASLLSVALITISGDAFAQRPPYRERPDIRDDGTGRNNRQEPGRFDYYVLALSWSPTYCADAGDRRDDPQCGPRRGARPYAFVLHGLWPQFERGWPEHCRSSDRGYVPRPVANRMLDIMPSDKLIFNEYRKHGTCSGLGVDGYFDLSRRLFEKVKIPATFTGLTDDRFTISPSDLVREFIEANRALKPDMIAVQCGGPGSRLREVRICFDKAGEFRACGHNENQRRLCSADRMYVPPVRDSVPATSRPRRGSPRDSDQDMLPGPTERRL